MSATQSFLRAGGKLSALIAFFAVAAIAGTLIACILTPGIAIAGSSASKQISAFQNLPSSLEITPLDQKSRMYAKDGKKEVLLASFYDQNRDILKQDQVTSTVKNAAIAAEDVRFYQHGPVDPNGIARALIKNSQGDEISGASTISQQYVKNVCIQQAEALPDKPKTDPKDQPSYIAYNACIDKSFNRKLREMRYAIGLEKKYSKDQILLGYLNIAGFGGQTYGIEAASQYYYDEPAKDLSIGQAATLMSIVNNPEKFRLDRKANFAGAEARRNYVLNTELKYGMISQADHDKAVAEKITVKITPPSSGCATAASAGFFCDYVVKSLLADPKLGKDQPTRLANLKTKGWRIETTLNLTLQKKAQSAMNLYVPKKQDFGDLGGSAVSVQVGTGRVLTMVQNKTYKPVGAKNRTNYSAVNYNTNQALGAGAGHQPGSTFKAFTMIGWLKSGHSLGQVVNGYGRTTLKQNFTACGRPVDYGPYQFKNDEKSDDNNYNIQDGTRKSVNGVFVSLGEEQDLCDLRSIAQSMGVYDGRVQRNKKGDAELDSNGNPKSMPLTMTPAMVIGQASAVAPLDMANAYATIADQGVLCTATGVEEVVDADGKTLSSPIKDCKRVQDKQLMIAAGYDLRNPFLGGTMGIDQLGDGKYLFGKTGTNDNAEGTWAIGSSTKVTTAVWVGNVNGHTNLRAYYGGTGCNIGNGWANKRHCVWQAIQREMDKTYGGASSWPTPESQYLYGGKAIVHADAKPKSAPKKESKKDDKGDDKGKGDDKDH